MGARDSTVAVDCASAAEGAAAACGGGRPDGAAAATNGEKTLSECFDGNTAWVLGNAGAEEEAATAAEAEVEGRFGICGGVGLGIRTPRLLIQVIACTTSPCRPLICSVRGDRSNARGAKEMATPYKMRASLSR